MAAAAGGGAGGNAEEASTERRVAGACRGAARGVQSSRGGGRGARLRQARAWGLTYAGARGKVTRPRHPGVVWCRLRALHTKHGTVARWTKRGIVPGTAVSLVKGLGALGRTSLQRRGLAMCGVRVGERCKAVRSGQRAPISGEWTSWLAHRLMSSMCSEPRSEARHVRWWSRWGGSGAQGRPADSRWVPLYASSNEQSYVRHLAAERQQDPPARCAAARLTRGRCCRRHHRAWRPWRRRWLPPPHTARRPTGRRAMGLSRQCHPPSTCTAWPGSCPAG